MNIPKSPLRQLYEQFQGKVNFVKNSKEQQDLKSKTVYLKVPCCDKLVRGVGSTIKQAKQSAAKYVLRKYFYNSNFS